MTTVVHFCNDFYLATTLFHHIFTKICCYNFGFHLFFPPPPMLAPPPRPFKPSPTRAAAPLLEPPPIDKDEVMAPAEFKAFDAPPAT